MIDNNGLPEHIAIIMDGNGRWARQRNLLRTQGHLEGVKRVEEITRVAARLGIKILTLFAFSTENWQRPKDEVNMLMRTFIQVLNNKIKELRNANIRFHWIGRRDHIPREVWQCIEEAVRLTGENTGLTLNLALNYGGRTEIVDAARRLAQKVRNEELSCEDISEDVFGKQLYTAAFPDPDLLIRTSGEKRISNFLLWQLSYSELYFTEKFWPEFNEEEFVKALNDFKQRERRYGTVGQPNH